MQHYGVMLSHYQGKPDFDALVRSGVEFINQKATEGATVIDPTFIPNVDAAYQRNLPVIAFHFYRPGKALAQLNSFLKVTNHPGVTFREIDFETGGASPSATIKEIVSISQDLLTATNQRPILYINPDYSHIFYGWGLNRLYYCLRHVANYDRGMPGSLWPFAGYHFWQYTQSARLDGIKGNAVLELAVTELTTLKELSMQKV